MVATLGKLASRALEHTKEQKSGEPRPSIAAEHPGASLPAPAAAAAPDSVNWTELVRRIQAGDESGMEDLYRLFARGVRFYLCRQLGAQELEDKIHDTFLIVVQAIRRGELREPERLMGFVRTVVRRQVAAHIDHVVHNRREQLHLDMSARLADARFNPEQSAAFHQRVELMLDVLGQLSGRDREILTRFYLQEQSQEQICEEMKLTDTQFRLLKSRAKARFGELGKRKLQQKPLLTVSLRKFSGGGALQRVEIVAGQLKAPRRKAQSAVLPDGRQGSGYGHWSCRSHSRRPSGSLHFGKAFRPGERPGGRTLAPVRHLPDTSGRSG